MTGRHANVRVRGIEALRFATHQTKCKNRQVAADDYFPQPLRPKRSHLYFYFNLTCIYLEFNVVGLRDKISNMLKAIFTGALKGALIIPAGLGLVAIFTGGSLLWLIPVIALVWLIVKYRY